MTAAQFDAPELARSLAESNRDATALLGREADRVEALAKIGVAPARLLGLAARLARDATRDLVAAADEVYEQWEKTYRSQRVGWTPEEKAAVCGGFAEWVEAVKGRSLSVRRLWGLVEKNGGTPDGAADLKAAAGRIGLVAVWIARAARPWPETWPPHVQERYEREMREHAEGKRRVVGPDEARQWFRGPAGETP